MGTGLDGAETSAELSRHVKLAAAGLIATIAMTAAAACGGGGGGKTVSVIPTLENPPVPTAVLSPTPTAACGGQGGLQFPANFPADVPKPPDAAVFSVQTTPYLRVAIRTTPPPSGRVPPFVVAGGSLIDRLTELKWTINRNLKAEGEDADIIAPDGRMGHVNALPARGCGTEVEITYDFKWITG